MNQKVFIIGGTGFIGYHVCRELLKKGYEVTAVSIDDVPEGFLPEKVKVIKADINKLSDDELSNLMDGHDYFIFAGGADDRLTVKAPAYEFFYKANVESVERLLTIAKNLNYKKVTILNSYFAYFNRNWPEMHLAETHPYIRSRVEQQEMAFKICNEDMPAAIIEIPYVIGVTPTKGSLWAGLIKYANSNGKYKFYTAGGTAIVSLRNVALAIANSLEVTQENTMYPVVDVNMTWEEWLKALRADKSKELKVITIPSFLVKIGAFFLSISQKIKGEAGGLNIVPFIDLQTKNTFLPVEESKARLNYGIYDINEDFEATIKLCMNN